MGHWARKFGPFYEAIRNDIFALCDAFHFSPTWQQYDFLEAVQDATYGRGLKKIEVISGQGTGKTTATVIAGIWRAMRFENAVTWVTAPTMAQCKDVWLTEARRLLKEAHSILRNIITATKSRIIMFGCHDWGVRFVTATRPENAQGRHEKHMTWIGDEASGIPRPLLTQIEGTLTNEDELFIMTGNPNLRDCHMFDCFTMYRHLWRCFVFNAEESPLCNPSTHKYIAEVYGRDSDTYRIRVLGQFPRQDPTCIMSSEDLYECSKTKLYKLIKIPRILSGTEAPAKQIGIDFAAFGGDESVAYRRLGEAIVERFMRPHVDPLDTVDRVFRMQTDAHWKTQETVYVPDCNGPGDGVVGRFYQANKNIFEFRSNHTSSDPEYDDRATEAWFAFARKVKSHTWYVEKDEELFSQLSTRQYTTTKKGKLILEEKKQWKKRMGKSSPDRADAMIMTAYDGVQQAAHIIEAIHAGKRVGMKIR